ncbi:hypothetical protein PRK78_002088 [Emydomyces testavorans]|uniref:RING-type domain-containing protein n=1 Tax=Emydomyces testavorans TaxID=2070801 RepID=A0AAF0DDT8_9EURO|nr:hypothetical protein PRK78_002088 [Emydomyces testavorans]
MAESRNEPSGEDPSVPITQGDDRRQPEAEQQSSETSDVGQDQRPPIPPATQGEALVGQRATAVGGNWNPPAGSHQTGASDGSTVYPSYNDPAYRAHFPLAGNNLAAGGSFPEAVNSVNNTPSAQQPFSDPIAFQRSWDEYIRREYARRLAFARAYQVPLASVRAAPNTGPNFHAGHMAPSTTGLPIPNHPPLTSIMIDTDRIPIPVVNPTAGGPQMAQGFPAHANFIAPDSNQNRARRRRHSEAFAMNDSQHEDTSVYPSTSRRVRTTAQRAFAAEEARLVPNAAADPFLNPQTINHHALAALAARVRGRTASTEYRRRVLGDSRPVKSLDCGNDGRPKPKDRSEMKVDFECKVCLSQKVDTVIIPCGHAVLCQWCAEQQIPSHPCFPSRPREAVTCPVCRKPVREKECTEESLQFRIYTP